MRRMLATIVCGVVLAVVGAARVGGQSPDAIASILTEHQFDLAGSGRGFLIAEASRARFVLVGGLHGDNETQALFQRLTEGLGNGPKLVVTELSPWAASRLAGAIPESTGIRLRGIDVESGQLERIVREVAAANPDNESVKRVVASVSGGYRRSMAPELLAMLRSAGTLKSDSVGGVSVATLLIRSLEVEADRSNPESSELTASLRRERVMKDFFLEQYRQANAPSGVSPPVAAVFGRNHMHRGIDRRGVSTLGNFIAEFAVAQGATVFNVALFASGGKVNFGGLQDIDERKDDIAFEYLASIARYPATVFDLRPLREPLRSLPVPARTPSQTSLLYWADSYDAVVYHREVTPMGAR